LLKGSHLLLKFVEILQNTQLYRDKMMHKTYWLPFKSNAINRGV